MGKIIIQLFVAAGLFAAAGLFPACQSIKQEDVKLAGTYTYRSKGLDKRFIDPENALGKNVIYADVIDHAGNDSFIIALQRPSIKYLRNHLGFYLYNRYLAYAAYLRNPAIVNTENGKFMAGIVESDSLNYKQFLARHATERNTLGDKKIELVIADSLIRYSPYYKRIAAGDDNYWIIRLSGDTLLGPFTQDAYRAERVILHIPAGLILKRGE